MGRRSTTRPSLVCSVYTRSRPRLEYRLFPMRLASALLVIAIARSARGQAEVVKPGAPLPSECNPRAGTMTLDSSAADRGTRGVIVGRIVDDHWRPIVAALVRLVSDTGRRASTSDSGLFRLTDLAIGPSQLEVRGIGRVRLVGDLHVRAGVAQYVTVMLRTARLDDPCLP